MFDEGYDIDGTSSGQADFMHIASLQVNGDGALIYMKLQMAKIYHNMSYQFMIYHANCSHFLHAIASFELQTCCIRISAGGVF